MLKKIAAFIITIGFITGLAQTSYAETKNPDNNPISKDFKVYFEKASTTAELNKASAEYKNAWEAELNNAAKMLKSKHKLAQDKKLIDDYVKQAKEMAQKSSELEALRWSGSDEKPEPGRSFGSAATSALLQPQASVYKQAALKLIEIYDEEGKEYKYIYKPQK